jgi:hypothetical protein
MKNYQSIISLIEKLLNEHDCIIIPNFGGFVVKFEDFKLNNQQSIISPRKRWIAFNERLNSDDGILATEWAGLHALSNKVAFQEINQFSKYIKAELAKNQSFILGNIGQFYLSTEANIVFSPNLKMNYDLTMFGLNDVIFQGENIIAEKIQPELIPPVNKSAQHLEIRTAEIEKENFTNKVILPKHIIYTIFAFIFTAFSAYFLTDPKTQYVYSSFSPLTLVLSKNNNSNSTTRIQPIEKETLSRKKIVKVDNEVDPSTHTKFSNTLKQDKIYLIAASFLTLAKAEIAREEFKLEGFKMAEVLPKNENDKYFRISLGNEETYEAGYKTASKIKETYKIDIWVYKP